MKRIFLLLLLGLTLMACQQRTDTQVRENVSTKESDNIGLPAIDKDDIILYRTGYTACYDSENKIPRWVAWHLTKEHTEGTVKRMSEFFADEDVTEPRAELTDYRRSGYDRGHMCPAGDNKWSEQAMRESFLLTNICPQNRKLNCGDWNELEIQCRRWAEKYGDIYIVTGPILYKGEHKTIGSNKVTVPEAFFKVILCMQGEPKAIGFIYKNEPCNNPKSSYVNSVDEIEKITGLDFFEKLDDAVENRVEKECSLGAW